LFENLIISEDVYTSHNFVPCTSAPKENALKKLDEPTPLISVKKELNRLYILGTLITWFVSYPAKSSQVLKNHSIMLFTSNANSL